MKDCWCISAGGSWCTVTSASYSCSSVLVPRHRPSSSKLLRGLCSSELSSLLHFNPRRATLKQQTERTKQKLKPPCPTTRKHKTQKPQPTSTSTVSFDKSPGKAQFHQAASEDGSGLRRKGQNEPAERLSSCTIQCEGYACSNSQSPAIRRCSPGCNASRLPGPTSTIANRELHETIRTPY